MTWLPELVIRNGVDWSDYESILYNHFCTDFISNCPTVSGKRIGIEKEPATKGRHRTFWHLISEGNIHEERTCCPLRCERIRWPKAIIVHAVSENLPVWKNKRGTRNNYLIATLNYDYVVVLAERKGYYYLWTAYVVEHESRRKKLRKEHDTYLADKAKP